MNKTKDTNSGASAEFRDRVNISIDSRLKRLFLDLKEFHGKSWTEALENAVRELLIKTDPVKILEYEIEKGECEQEERRKALTRTKATALDQT